jgi:transposase
LKREINMRNKYSARFKAEVALIALREEQTTSEISKKYGVPCGVINRWRREAISSLSKCFSDENRTDLEASEAKIEFLERKIGQLTVDSDFLKKNYTKYYLKGGMK